MNVRIPMCRNYYLASAGEEQIQRQLQITEENAVIRDISVRALNRYDGIKQIVLFYLVPGTGYLVQ